MEPLVCKDTYAWVMNKRNKQQSLAYGRTHIHHLIFDILQVCFNIHERWKKDESRNRIVSLDFDFLPTISTITASIKKPSKS